MKAGLLVLATMAMVGMAMPSWSSSAFSEAEDYTSTIEHRYSTHPAAAETAQVIWLDELDLDPLMQSWGVPHARQSVEGKPLSIAGQQYERGVGTHAHSELHLKLHGQVTRFRALAGLDDETGGGGLVNFVVLLDDRELVRTGPMKSGDPAREIDVDLSGGRMLSLVVDDAGNGGGSDHADWCQARFTLAPDATMHPEPFRLVPDTAIEIASGDPPAPAIHGPRITGCKAGKPFLFRIPATGQQPLTFRADGLPPGLELDSTSGVISGQVISPGTTTVLLSVSNTLGAATRELAISANGVLALTPPLGWNSWNVWGLSIDATRVQQAADWMVRTGLANKGYQYINIDDGWEAPERTPEGELLANSKFPDMRALADHVHSLGLKLGIYSSPGPTTCGGYLASWQHEQQDANTWAGWGIDYLKYDWCSYGNVATGEGQERLEKPYHVMRTALNNVDRDIVFSLCQYGMGDVWTWGANVGGNLWRTTGDINDTWDSIDSIGFGQDGRQQYAGPGHWNDPDMMVVGKVGWGPNVHPTKLTPAEQQVHVTLWTLLAAPILLGNDLADMDQFTIDLLGNTEVIDIHQDTLGRQGWRITQDGPAEVWARPLAGGDWAVGLFNRGVAPAEVTVRWADLGLSGRPAVRDVWRWQDLGSHADSFTSQIQPHGCLLIRVSTP